MGSLMQSKNIVRALLVLEKQQIAESSVIVGTTERVTWSTCALGELGPLEDCGVSSSVWVFFFCFSLDCMLVCSSAGAP